jgi:hypothetical protein
MRTRRAWVIIRELTRDVVITSNLYQPRILTRQLRGLFPTPVTEFESLYRGLELCHLNALVRAQLANHRAEMRVQRGGRHRVLTTVQRRVH